jgi:hypothetical protein
MPMGSHVIRKKDRRVLRMPRQHLVEGGDQLNYSRETKGKMEAKQFYVPFRPVIWLPLLKARRRGGEGT